MFNITRELPTDIVQEKIHLSKVRGSYHSWSSRDFSGFKKHLGASKTTTGCVGVQLQFGDSRKWKKSSDRSTYEVPTDSHWVRRPIIRQEASIIISLYTTIKYRMIFRFFDFDGLHRNRQEFLGPPSGNLCDFQIFVGAFRENFNKSYQSQIIFPEIMLDWGLIEVSLKAVWALGLLEGLLAFPTNSDRTSDWAPDRNSNLPSAWTFDLTSDHSWSLFR